jgi:hypothetical protein
LKATVNVMMFCVVAVMEFDGTEMVVYGFCDVACAVALMMI